MNVTLLGLGLVLVSAAVFWPELRIVWAWLVEEARFYRWHRWGK